MPGKNQRPSCWVVVLCKKWSCERTTYFLKIDSTHCLFLFSFNALLLKLLFQRQNKPVNVWSIATIELQMKLSHYCNLCKTQNSLGHWLTQCNSEGNAWSEITNLNVQEKSMNDSSRTCNAARHWQTSFHWPKSWKSCHCWNLWKYMGFHQLTDKIKLGSEPSKWMGQSGFYQENWWTHWEFRHEQRRKRRNIVCLNCCTRWWPSLLLASLQPANVNMYIYIYHIYNIYIYIYNIHIYIYSIYIYIYICIYNIYIYILYIYMEYSMEDKCAVHINFVG